ncbi:MAG: PleD family two-component system response regulator [Chlorobiota bacterium]
MHSALIIDDDIWMQRIMLKNLKQYGFDEIFTVSNGFEGIALAVEHEPTLIVLDIIMKELDGLVTLKILKAIKNTQDIPVLVGSGVTDVDLIARIVKAGSSHFISKPYSKSTLEAKLLEIFGAEKLELLKNRIPFTDKELGYFPEEKFKRSESEIDKNKTSDSSDKGSIPKSNKKNIRKMAAKHYSEEESKNIDALKKLLLKNTKKKK